MAKESVEAVIGDLQTLFGSYHKELDRLEQAKDGAYKERNMLLAGFCALAIAQGYKAFIMQHVGEEWDDDWRNIVCVELPTGQVTWHIHDSEMDLFKGLPHKDENVWDGHDTETKYQRVVALKYNVPKMMRDKAQAQMSESEEPNALGVSDSELQDLADVVNGTQEAQDEPRDCADADNTKVSDVVAQDEHIRSVAKADVDAQLEALREFFHNFLCHAIPKDSPTFDSLLGKVRPILEQWAQKVAELESNHISEDWQLQAQGMESDSLRANLTEMSNALEKERQRAEQAEAEVARLREFVDNCLEQEERGYIGLTTNNLRIMFRDMTEKAIESEGNDE